MFSETAEKRGKKVIDGLYYFAEKQMLDCNQFLIVGKDDELALFDTGNGMSLNGLFEGMKKLNLDYKNITKVFLTHEHVDHVLGLYKLMKRLEKKPPQIYAYGETAKILNEGDESQIFPGNLGISASMFGIEIIPLEVIDLKEKKEIDVNSDFTFQIHYTPGHSLGSISYYDPSKKILIPGDLVFTGGSFGRYDFPGGSLKTLQESIGRVNELDVIYLLPGHMGISDDGNSQIEFSYKMAKSINNYF